MARFFVLFFIALMGVGYFEKSHKIRLRTRKYNNHRRNHRKIKFAYETMINSVVFS